MYLDLWQNTNIFHSIGFMSSNNHKQYINEIKCLQSKPTIEPNESFIE